MAKFNLPKDSATIRVCYQSEHGSLYKSNMPQKNSDIIFTPGFYERVSIF